MAALYPDPFARFIIAPNKPNNGGKVFFFENGTTTLKQTFSDVTLLTPNTNPLILNSNGNFQVQVFANDSDIFSVEVKDSNDIVTQPTIDNVNFLSEFLSRMPESQSVAISRASSHSISSKAASPRSPTRLSGFLRRAGE